MKLDLTAGWTLRNVTNLGVLEAVDGRDVPATVPGCVHTDLLDAGLIPDPYYAQNELALQWIGENEWRYACTFEVSADLLSHDHLELVCEGLDTVATVHLNGEVVGKGENMHLEYRFDAKPYLNAGTNDLSITFHAALGYADAHLERLGYLPNSSYPHPFNFIRKMACNFGWDWGPTFITAGIWQPVHLEAWRAARLASVRPLVLSANEERAVLEVRADIGGEAAELALEVTLTDPAGNVLTEKGLAASPVTLEVPEPHLWFPRGYGEQPLYTLEVTLKQGERVLDTWQHPIGLRQVRLDTGADEIGSKFVLEVNGVPIFCKGANWIPDDCFVTRVTPKRYRERVTQAVDAGMNTLRVWGGGLYEQTAFYETCDELGVLVWQDFLFACALYPEEEPFRSLVEREARQQIARLSRHPSLVLWNGNNENLWGYVDWERDGKTWREWAEGRTWGAGFYFGLLPKLVQELDPSRPYTPGSPYSGSMDVHPLSDAHGTKHMWDVWNRQDYTVYRDHVPRFAAEFGFQAPPNFATLRESIPESERRPDSAAMLHHQKAENGNGKLRAGLERHFNVPETFADWHFATQLNQARALQLGIEWFRAHTGRCMGTLYWQLNDCWPVTSWASVDGHGRKKLLWYATKRFFADRLLTFQPHGEALSLHLVNDTSEAWAAEVTLLRLTFSGEVCAETTISVRVAPRSAEEVVLEPPLTHPDHRSAELLTADADGQRTFWYFARDKTLRYPDPDFGADLEKTSTGYRLSLTAHTLLRDLCLLVDKLEPNATTDTQLLTLLPGETGAFEIETAETLSLEDCTRSDVLFSANRLGALHDG